MAKDDGLERHAIGPHATDLHAVTGLSTMQKS